MIQYMSKVSTPPGFIGQQAKPYKTLPIKPRYGYSRRRRKHLDSLSDFNKCSTTKPWKTNSMTL